MIKTYLFEYQIPNIINEVNMRNLLSFIQIPTAVLFILQHNYVFIVLV